MSEQDPKPAEEKSVFEGTNETMTPAEVSALKRKIQLEGGRDPEHFTLPGGQTLAEYQRAQTKAHLKEGEETLKNAIDSARQQSIEGQGLADKVQVATSEGGHIVTRAIVPEPTTESEGTTSQTPVNRTAAVKQPPVATRTPRVRHEEVVREEPSVDQ